MVDVANDATSTPSVTPSPADTLRQAAALMRERAKYATQGPWETDDFAAAYCVYSPPADTFVTDPTDWDMSGGDSEYIASWHPLVALAVADWLDYQAIACEYNERAWREGAANPENRWAERSLTVEANLEHHHRDALAVARAYLGEA